MTFSKAIFATGVAAGGTLTAAEFYSAAGATAQNTSQHFIYDQTSGVLSYDADGSGAGAAVEIVTLGANLLFTDIRFVA